MNSLSLFVVIVLASASTETEELVQILKFKGLLPSKPKLNRRSQDWLSRPGNLTHARYYALYAGASACSLESLEQWNCSHCIRLGKSVKFHAVIKDPHRSTLGLVTVDKKRKEIVLSFRGTSNFKNWFQNFKVMQSDFPDAMFASVHTGFQECSDGLFEKYHLLINRLLQHPDHNAFNVVVTGHSLGGAIAILATLRLQKELNLSWDRLSVYTYGQPRVGNVYFADYINYLPLSVTRVVNDNDLVPHLPPFAYHYLHYHTEVHINHDIPNFCSRVFPEDPSCASSRTDFSIASHLSAFGIQLGKKGCT
ncbi:hypothetical protein DSO57_1035720 [Entomophthora muscae]|uniref:Uncharacterized protein n=1 Tax=Entomophthora muscae TaxID=34485 RepID=A0ACC2RQD4_9FUNG|nr:hypothetical protein DSO57_1035720 [Entomophthora muscae]